MEQESKVQEVDIGKERPGHQQEVILWCACLGSGRLAWGRC